MSDADSPRKPDVLSPFARVASGIPANWPGECVLFHDDDRGCLNYHASGHESGWPTISEWRALAAAALSLAADVTLGRRAAEALQSAFWGPLRGLIGPGDDLIGDGIPAIVAEVERLRGLVAILTTERDEHAEASEARRLQVKSYRVSLEAAWDKYRRLGDRVISREGPDEVYVTHPRPELIGRRFASEAEARAAIEEKGA